MAINDLKEFWTLMDDSQQYFHLQTIIFPQFLMVASLSHKSCSIFRKSSPSCLKTSSYIKKVYVFKVFNKICLSSSKMIRVFDFENKFGAFIVILYKAGPDLDQDPALQKKRTPGL